MAKLMVVVVTGLAALGGTYTIVFDKRWIQTRNPGTFTRASVDKNTLEPLGGKEPCRVRQFIWAGQWTRS